jgi:hypothetical protein
MLTGCPFDRPLGCNPPIVDCAHDRSTSTLSTTSLPQLLYAAKPAGSLLPCPLPLLLAGWIIVLGVRG